jgi:MATE family multidrug resistance protein
VANEIGRGSARSAKFSVLITVLTSFAIGFILFLVFLFLEKRLAYIFTTSSDVADAVGDLSSLLAFSILLNSVQPVLSGNLYLFFLVIFTFMLINYSQSFRTMKVTLKV